MRINSVIPYVNNNNNNKQSFGMVSFERWGEWYVGLSKSEPDVVSVDGFKDFSSENAKFVTKMFSELGARIFDPENYKEIRAKLNLIVGEARINLPMFTEKDAGIVRSSFNSEKPRVLPTLYTSFIDNNNVL